MKKHKKWARTSMGVDAQALVAIVKTKLMIPEPRQFCKGVERDAVGKNHRGVEC